MPLHILVHRDKIKCRITTGNFEIFHAIERWKNLIVWGLGFGDAPDMPELSLHWDQIEFSLSFFIAKTVKSLNYLRNKSLQFSIIVNIPGKIRCAGMYTELSVQTNSSPLKDEGLRVQFFESKYKTPQTLSLQIAIRNWHERRVYRCTEKLARVNRSKWCEHTNTIPMSVQ